MSPERFQQERLLNEGQPVEYWTNRIGLEGLMFIARSNGPVHQVCVVGPPGNDDLEAFEVLLGALPAHALMSVRIEDDLITPEEVALYLVPIEHALKRGVRVTCQRAASVECHLCSATALCDAESVWELARVEGPRRVQPGVVQGD